MAGIRVVKVGGNELDDRAWLGALAAVLAREPARTVVVHGGGREVSELQRALGAEPEWRDGLRVTSPAALRATTMVLSGTVNKRLVAALVGAGADALGISGEDGALLRAEFADGGALGRTGRIAAVRAGLLHAWLAAGWLPVVSPVSRGPDGGALNVNADDAAAAVAAALGAEELLFVSDIAGVLHGGSALASLDAGAAERMIQCGEAGGGMAPKLRAALRAAEAGVAMVRIGALEMLTDQGAGTRLMASTSEAAGACVATPGRADALLGTYRPAGPVFVGGEGSHLVAEDGRRFLDFTSGIAVNALGYGDADVGDAIRAALDGGLIHASNLFRTAPAAELAAWLTEHSFASRVFFCNSGAEANEGAIKFARRWARAQDGDAKTEIVAFRGGFHGRTMGALAATDRPAHQAPFAPLMPGVRFCTIGDEAEASRCIGPATAAVLIEPIQAEGGVLPVPAEFFRILRRRCDAAGALLIVDEVQTGLGRTGALWAHERSGVAPDLMTLAKPLAGGLPMGAVLLAEHVAAAVQPGDHGSTFGGGPLVASAALAVCRKIGNPAFLAEVRRKAHLLANRLHALALRNPEIVAVRGAGMIWGIELSGPAAPVVERALEAGLLLCTAGAHVVRLLPPLVATDEELVRGIDLLESALP